jgi:hypothetical protein
MILDSGCSFVCHSQQKLRIHVVLLFANIVSVIMFLVTPQQLEIYAADVTQSSLVIEGCCRRFDVQTSVLTEIPYSWDTSPCILE